MCLLYWGILFVLAFAYLDVNRPLPSFTQYNVIHAFPTSKCSYALMPKKSRPYLLHRIGVSCSFPSPCVVHLNLMDFCWNPHVYEPEWCWKFCTEGVISDSQNDILTHFGLLRFRFIYKIAAKKRTHLSWNTVLGEGPHNLLYSVQGSLVLNKYSGETPEEQKRIRWRTTTMLSLYFTMFHYVI